MYGFPARLSAVAILSICLSTFVAPTGAQTSDETEALRKQIEELREHQAVLQEEVRKLRSIVDSLMTPPQDASGRQASAELPTSGRPSRGRTDAVVTIVEFADYQSADCARYFTEAYPEILRRYVDTGAVRYVFKSFPMQSDHPQAFKAHEAAACAGDQGSYWEMHDRLLANQDELAPEQLVEHAKTLGVDADMFRSCLVSGAHSAAILSDIDEAKRGGVTGTPLFVIGLTRPGTGSVQAQRIVAGAQPYAVFEQAIEAVLATARHDR